MQISKFSGPDVGPTKFWKFKRSNLESKFVCNMNRNKKHLLHLPVNQHKDESVNLFMPSQFHRDPSVSEMFAFHEEGLYYSKPTTSSTTVHVVHSG